MPPWYYQLCVISSNVATTNTRATGFVPTLLPQVHPSPLGPLARKRGMGHLLCGTKEMQMAPFAHAVLGGDTARGWEAHGLHNTQDLTNARDTRRRKNVDIPYGR